MGDIIIWRIQRPNVWYDLIFLSIVNTQHAVKRVNESHHFFSNSKEIIGFLWKSASMVKSLPSNQTSPRSLFLTMQMHLIHFYRSFWPQYLILATIFHPGHYTSPWPLYSQWPLYLTLAIISHTGHHIFYESFLNFLRRGNEIIKMLANDDQIKKENKLFTLEQSNNTTNKNEK